MRLFGSTSSLDLFPATGYLQGISVREGQAVKKGDLMFKIVPVLYKARLDAELADARLAELEYNNTES